eukprot:g17525.t1
MRSRCSSTYSTISRLVAAGAGGAAEDEASVSELIHPLRQLGVVCAESLQARGFGTEITESAFDSMTEGGGAESLQARGLSGELGGDVMTEDSNSMTDGSLHAAGDYSAGVSTPLHETTPPGDRLAVESRRESSVCSAGQLDQWQRDVSEAVGSGGGQEEEDSLTPADAPPLPPPAYPPWERKITEGSAEDSVCSFSWIGGTRCVGSDRRTAERAADLSCFAVPVVPVAPAQNAAASTSASAGSGGLIASGLPRVWPGFDDAAAGDSYPRDGVLESWHGSPPMQLPKDDPPTPPAHAFGPSASVAAAVGDAGLSFQSACSSEGGYESLVEGERSFQRKPETGSAVGKLDCSRAPAAEVVGGSSGSAQGAEVVGGSGSGQPAVGDGVDEPRSDTEMAVDGSPAEVDVLDCRSGDDSGDTGRPVPSTLRAGDCESHFAPLEEVRGHRAERAESFSLKAPSRNLLAPPPASVQHFSLASGHSSRVSSTSSLTKSHEGDPIDDTEVGTRFGVGVLRNGVQYYEISTPGIAAATWVDVVTPGAPQGHGLRLPVPDRVEESKETATTERNGSGAQEEAPVLVDQMRPEQPWAEVDVEQGGALTQEHYDLSASGHADKSSGAVTSVAQAANSSGVNSRYSDEELID